ncbi:reverse transcriptase [Elysia marginata]|uniref:Reverse transcriptase n=1 Tax=Elysia marginata TaxID=1093978 RepID=A0AAV4G2D9_9GAST|nr:reverse transcriptase [Elysia marginata]
MKNKLDIVSGSHHQESTVSKLNTLVSEFQLTDIWRQQHQEEKNFTWSRRNPLIARRLDYIFLGENLISHATDLNIKSIGFSDHRPIFATLNFATFEHGPSTYKLNVSLLNDPAYIEIVNEYLDNALDKFADLDPHQRWEMIKIEIKEISRQYGRFRYLIQRQEKKRNLNLLHQLEKALIHDTAIAAIEDEIYKLKKQMEVSSMEESRGAQIRARLKWIEKGGKAINFFLG